MQRMLSGGAGVGDKLHACAGNRRLNRRFDFFDRLQISSPLSANQHCFVALSASRFLIPNPYFLIPVLCSLFLADRDRHGPDAFVRGRFQIMLSLLRHPHFSSFSS